MVSVTSTLTTVWAWTMPTWTWLLTAHGQRAVYVPGRTVNRMAGAYRGEAKTDARDAYVIAETARHRRDFATLDVPAQLAADPALLTTHRTDLVTDRVRTVNRLRDVLTGMFPALERAFDYSARKGALVPLAGHQTPAALRRRGLARLTAWLGNRGVRDADSMAAAAVEAAQAQQSCTAQQGRRRTDRRRPSYSDPGPGQPAGAHRPADPRHLPHPPTSRHPTPATWPQPPDWSPSPAIPTESFAGLDTFAGDPHADTPAA